MGMVDEATGIREGEELDRVRLHAFLLDSIPGLDGPLDVRQFPSGYSNLTYLVRVGNRELVLRRPPFGTKAKTAHDMGREWRVLTALHPEFPYCPKPLVYTEDTSVIGTPFYLMERLRGIILRKDLPPGLSLSPSQGRKLSQRFFDVLAELHSVDYERIGLGGFGKPAGYVERQVTGWARRYDAARTPDAPDMADVIAWLQEKMPPDSARPGIVHNDYRLDNVVLDEKDPTRIIGVLDWEMATLGDPLMDFGSSLAYWVRKEDPPDLHLSRLAPTHLEGMLDRREVVEYYERRSGRAIGEVDFYYCFGLFRLAVIFQQIYYRYYQGETRDERFKDLIFVVHGLDAAARRVTAQPGI